MTDVDIQLSDMLESYPSSMTPGFQTLLTAKKEFSELASDPTERLPPGRGRYFKHQKFMMRFLRNADDVLLCSEPGSGKSCEALSFCEKSRKELEKAKVDPSHADEKVAHFKRVIILYKGKTQKEELRKQLACKCSDGHYESGIVRKATKEKSQKSALTNEFKKAGYSFQTYIAFAHDIAKNYPTEADNERLAEDYSDTIFWIDEGHNLIVDPNNVNKYKEKQYTLATIWRVFHLARRSKRIITTATPMINDPKDLGSVLNLILPLNGIIPPGYDYRNAPPNDIRVLFPGLPFDPKTATPEQVAPYFRGQIPKEYNFETATLEDLEPLLRGRVGFIRASETGAIPVEQGIPQNGVYEINGLRYQSQLVLYPNRMSEHQTYGVEGGGGGYMMIHNAMTGQKDIFGSERQAANFVFPDGWWGNGTTEDERAARKAMKAAKAAIKAAITSEREGQSIQVEELPEGGFIPIIGGAEIPLEEEEATETERRAQQRAFRRFVNVRGDSYTPTVEFSYWLQDIRYIRMLSCKYAEIIRLIMETPGNAFVYDEFVDGSGLIVLALCLEGMGFTRYDESRSMFLGAGSDIIKPLCSGSDVDAATRRVRPDMQPRLRYALLTSETSGTKFTSMMEAINSYENRHGDYIKVFLTSRVGRDAINVNNVLQIHLVGSEWNPSAMYQAQSRGIRATSHEDLIREEQERIRAEGGDPATARVEVRIYKHAAVAANEEGSSIDLEMYLKSEYKDRTIRRLMRILKQCAIGCQVHYNRNVRPTDIDGSAACDYDVCQYSCVDPPPTEEDFSTYDVLYADEIVKDASKDIKDIYRQWNVLTLNDIANALPQYRRKYLIMALEQLITNKTPLIDRFGYTTYLREDKGSFYLDRTFPTGTPASYAMSYYTQGIIGIEQETLSNIVAKLESGENIELFARLEQIGPQGTGFIEQLGALSIESQANLLEETVIRELRGQGNDFTNAVITKFQRFLFSMNEPVTELNKANEELTIQKPKRGRRKNPEGKRRIKKINPTNVASYNIVRDEGTELVYLHTIYSQITNQTAYATTAKANKGEGRTRLLKPSEINDGWRDLNKIELPIYNAYIQIEIANRKKPLEDMGLYGFFHSNGKFLIRDRLTESAKAASDARQIKRGKVCITWSRPDLIDVMWEIGVPVPGAGTFDFVPGQEPQIIQVLFQRKINKSYEELATWSLDRLTYYYKWYVNRTNRTVICDMIKARMAETGRILE